MRAAHVEGDPRAIVGAPQPHDRAVALYDVTRVVASHAHALPEVKALHLTRLAVKLGTISTETLTGTVQPPPRTSTTSPSPSKLE